MNLKTAGKRVGEDRKYRAKDDSRLLPRDVPGKEAWRDGGEAGSDQCDVRQWPM